MVRSSSCTASTTRVSLCKPHHHIPPRALSSHHHHPPCVSYTTTYLRGPSPLTTAIRGPSSSHLNFTYLHRTSSHPHQHTHPHPPFPPPTIHHSTTHHPPPTTHHPPPTTHHPPPTHPRPPAHRYTTELLSGGGGRQRPIYTYSLPSHTLPGSLLVSKHTILCTQEHRGSTRSLVLARHLAEETATAPSSHAASPGATPPHHHHVTSGAAARHAALRRLVPHAILQDIPLPRGTVMLVPPLGHAAPLGDFLYASRTSLHALKPWRSAEAICRRLLAAPLAAPSASPSTRTPMPGDEGGDEGDGERACGVDDAASRIGLAWVLARTYALDFDALSAAHQPRTRATPTPATAHRPLPLPRCHRPPLHCPRSLPPRRCSALPHALTARRTAAAH
jgi:hypothetical protein